MRSALLGSVLLCVAGFSASAQQPGVVTGGSQDVQIGGHPSARQGDTTSDGNVIVEGSKDVFINGKPAAVLGSKTNCGGLVVGGHGGVFINGKPAARTGDATAGCPGK